MQVKRMSSPRGGVAFMISLLHEMVAVRRRTLALSARFVARRLQAQVRPLK
jgi:hypothetical protein